MAKSYNLLSNASFCDSSSFINGYSNAPFVFLFLTAYPSFVKTSFFVLFCLSKNNLSIRLPKHSKRRRSDSLMVQILTEFNRNACLFYHFLQHRKRCTFKWRNFVFLKFYLKKLILSSDQNYQPLDQGMMIFRDSDEYRRSIIWYLKFFILLNILIKEIKQKRLQVL